MEKSTCAEYTQVLFLIKVVGDLESESRFDFVDQAVDFRFERRCFGENAKGMDEYFEFGRDGFFCSVIVTGKELVVYLEGFFCFFLGKISLYDGFDGIGF